MRRRVAALLCHPVPYFSRFYAEASRRPGIDLRVYYATDDGVRSYWDREFDREVRWDVPLLDGYAHEFLPVRRSRSNITYLGLDCREAGARLAEFGPDAIILHGWAWAFLWRAASWGRRQGVPSMIYSDSHAGHRDSAWKRILKDPIVRRFYSFVDGALVTGDNNREYHRRFGIPEDRMFDGGLPIVTSHITEALGSDRASARRRARESLRVPEDAFVVLFLGKLIPRKRPRDLVKAAERLARDGRPVHIIVAGDGPLRDELKAAAEGLPAGSVHFTGFLNQGETAVPLLASDVLVLPSEREALGAVVGEALAAGVPSVVSDRVGCLSADGFAVEGVTAISYPCGDTESLASVLQRLRADRGLLAGMSAAALDRSRSIGPADAARLLETAVHGLVEKGPRRMRGGPAGFGRAS